MGVQDFATLRWATPTLPQNSIPKEMRVNLGVKNIGDSVTTRTSDDIKRFITHLPLETTDRLTVVLKGHLLVEELLREYIWSQFESPGELDKARLSFHHCLCMAKALSAGNTDDKLWESVERLNGLRNQLAHNLEPKALEAKIRDFVEKLSTFNASEEYVRPDLKLGTLSACVMAVCLALSAKLNTNKKEGH